MPGPCKAPGRVRACGSAPRRGPRTGTGSGSGSVPPGPAAGAGPSRGGWRSAPGRPRSARLHGNALPRMRRSPLSIMGQRVCSRPAPAAPPERGTTTPTSPRGGGAPVRVSFPLAPPSPAAAARRLLIGGSAAGPRHRRWRPSGRWGSGGRRHFVCLERGSGQRRPPRRGRGAPGERPGSGGGAAGGRAGSAGRRGRASVSAGAERGGPRRP